MKIIIDTNFILSCLKQKIDLFSQLEELFPVSEIIVPERVIDELENIKNKKTRIKEREATSLALQILEKNKDRIIILNLEGRVDDAIVSYALNNNVIVATLDREIKKQLKNKARFLTIKGKKRISLV